MPHMPSMQLGGLELSGTHLSGPPRRAEIARKLIPPSRGTTAGLSIRLPKGQDESRPTSRGSLVSSMSIPQLRSSRPNREQLVYQVRNPEILLPAWDMSNDVTRIRNMGKPLQSRHGALMSSTSAPNLGMGSSLASPSKPSPRREVPTLRLPPSTLNLVSQVVCQYDVNPLLDCRPKPSPRYDLPSEASPRRFKQREDLEVPLEVACQKLPKVEEIASVTTSISTQKYKPTFELKKSMHLMEGLWTLRRLNNKGGGDSPRSGSPSPRPGDSTTTADPLDGGPSMESLPDSLGPEGSRHSHKTSKGEEQEDGMLQATLKDVNDTVESLNSKAADILGAKVLVDRLGKRHPTNVMSTRTLEVIQRKEKLLVPLEERFKEFKFHALRKEELLRLIVDKNEDAPEVLFGSQKYFQQFIHQNLSCACEPVDDSMRIINFNIFLGYFRLPKKHGIFTRWMEFGNEIGQWWAEQAWIEAEKGASHKAIKTLIDMSMDMFVKKDHHMLLRAHQILIDRLCNHCLAFAKEMWEKDQMAEKKAEQRGQIVALGLASQLADKVEEEIFKTVSEGGEKLRDEPRVRQAQEISKNLREQDNTRKRLHAREDRLKEEAKTKALAPHQ